MGERQLTHSPRTRPDSIDTTGQQPRAGRHRRPDQPDLVAVGGDTARAGDLFLDPARTGLRRYALAAENTAISLVGHRVRAAQPHPATSSAESDRYNHCRAGPHRTPRHQPVGQGVEGIRNRIRCDPRNSYTLRSLPM